VFRLIRILESGMKTSREPVERSNILECRGYNPRFILDSSLESSHGFDYIESDPNGQRPD
jgi:hypothetical protein